MPEAPAASEVTAATAATVDRPKRTGLPSPKRGAAVLAETAAPVRRAVTVELVQPEAEVEPGALSTALAGPVGLVALAGPAVAVRQEVTAATVATVATRSGSMAAARLPARQAMAARAASAGPVVPVGSVAPVAPEVPVPPERGPSVRLVRAEPLAPVARQEVQDSLGLLEPR